MTLTDSHNPASSATPNTADSWEWRGIPVATRQMGSGPALLMIHGWGSSSVALEPLANALSDIRTCHLIDLPGFGQSPAPTFAFSVDDYADLISDWTDRLNLPVVDLLVHSYGGRIALKLLSRQEGSDRFRKVLITGGAGLTPKRSWRYYYRRTLASLLKAPLRLLPGSLRDRANHRMRQSRLWKSLGSSEYNQLQGVMRETFVRSVTERLDHTLPSISHEVLLVWGTEDKATPLDQGQRMEKGLKHGVLIPIKGAGHYAFLDKPGPFAAIARAYFEPDGSAYPKPDTHSS